jgi:hypothetical protein
MIPMAYRAGQWSKEFPTEDEMIRRIVESRIKSRIAAEVEAELKAALSRAVAQS